MYQCYLKNNFGDNNTAVFGMHLSCHVTQALAPLLMWWSWRNNHYTELYLSVDADNLQAQPFKGDNK